MHEISARALFDKSSLGVLARVTCFWCAYLAILFAASMVKSRLPSAWGPLAWGAVSSALLFLLTWILVKSGSRSAAAFKPAANARGFSYITLGALVGLAVHGVNLGLVSLIAGPLSFAWNPEANPGMAFLAVASYFALSAMEELGFRGWSLWRLHERFGLWPAQLISASCFGLCHVLFGWTWDTVLFGVVPGGLLFGMAALFSRGLAMPVGVHAGLNIAAWSVGGKGLPGLWIIDADASTTMRAAALAPVTGPLIALLVAILLFLRHRKSKREASK